MPRVNEHAFFAFVHAADYLTQGAVLIQREPFYVSITRYFEDDCREQLGNDEVEHAWDRYRGGLEYMIAARRGDRRRRALRPARPDPADDRLRMTSRSACATPRSASPVDTYHLAMRLRGIGYETSCPCRSRRSPARRCSRSCARPRARPRRAPDDLRRHEQREERTTSRAKRACRSSSSPDLARCAHLSDALLFVRDDASEAQELDSARAARATSASSTSATSSPSSRPTAGSAPGSGSASSASAACAGSGRNRRQMLRRRAADGALTTCAGTAPRCRARSAAPSNSGSPWRCSHQALAQRRAARRIARRARRQLPIGVARRRRRARRGRRRAAGWRRRAGRRSARASVTTGTPTQSASLAVVCALHGQASRNRSARSEAAQVVLRRQAAARRRAARRRCRARAPPPSASAARCGSTAAARAPIPAARCSRSHQVSNTSGEILYDWWKAHSTRASSAQAPVGARRGLRAARGARRSAGSNAAAGRSSR